MKVCLSERRSVPSLLPRRISFSNSAVCLALSLLSSGLELDLNSMGGVGIDLMGGPARAVFRGDLMPVEDLIHQIPHTPCDGRWILLLESSKDRGMDGQSRGPSSQSSKLLLQYAFQ